PQRRGDGRVRLQHLTRRAGPGGRADAVARLDREQAGPRALPPRLLGAPEREPERGFRAGAAAARVRRLRDRGPRRGGHGGRGDQGLARGGARSVSTASDQALELKEVPGPSALGGGTRRAFELLYVIAVNDFKKTYFGTVLGYLWSLARPLLTFA